MKTAKKYFYISIALILLVIFALMIKENITVDASAVSINKVKVFGCYEQTFMPDTAYVTIGVESEDVEVSVAQQNNASTMDNVITLLQEYGVEDGNIKTTGYKILNKHYYMDETSEKATKVLNYVEFKTKDINNLNSLIESLTNSGVNYVNNVRFCLEDTSDEYASVLQGALESARQKAEALTGNSNLVAVEIEEGGVFCNPCNYNNYSLAKTNDISNNLNSGCVTVSANIAVTFEAN